MADPPTTEPASDSPTDPPTTPPGAHEPQGRPPDQGEPDLSRLDDEEVFDRAVSLLVDLTDALLEDVRALGDDDVRAPSRLPRWTRGHVLAHLARNADAFANLLTWARTGEETPMYASREARDADIEAGSHRSAADHEADVEASAERLLEQVAALPADRRGAPVRVPTGAMAPAYETLWGRIREVAYHHVDLDVGRSFADLPPAVLRRGLAESVTRLQAGNAPDLDLDAADLGWQGRVGAGTSVGGASVSGTGAALLGWLTGRTDGEDLAGPAPLPALPSWG